MSLNARLLLNALLRLVLLAFGVWIAFGGDAALQAPMITRLGIVILFATCSVLLGELGYQREHVNMLMKLFRATATGSKRSDRDAIDILIQGLSSADESRRSLAHHHLKRLTGQDMPPEPALWQAWWAANRDAFQPREVP